MFRSSLKSKVSKSNIFVLFENFKVNTETLESIGGPSTSSLCLIFQRNVLANGPFSTPCDSRLGHISQNFSHFLSVNRSFLILAIYSQVKFPKWFHVNDIFE